MALHNRRRILITIDWFLPGYKAGGPIQSCANLIAHLKDEYEFWIITRDTDYCTDEPYTTIQSDKWNQLEENVHVYYFSQQNLKFSSLFQVMKEVKADVAYINGIYSFYFSILPVLIAKSISIREILVAGRGMLAAGSVNVKSRKKKAFFTFAKLIKLYNGVTFHATNNVEENDIQAVLGKTTVVKIAPNLPQKLTHYQTIKREKVKGILKMISVARVSPEKNTKYALEVLSNYKGSGSIAFDIYGPIYNQTYWEECKKVIAQLPPNVTVTFKDSLASHLVRERLTEYHALFMPTTGENFGHIILESLTAGSPVIISDKTPWRELKTSGVGFDLPLDEPKSFVNAIEEFVQMDTEHFNQLSVKAVAFAKEYINDVTSVEANKSLFAS